MIIPVVLVGVRDELDGTSLHDNTREECRS